LSQKIGDYPIQKYLGSAKIGKIEEEHKYFDPKTMGPVYGPSRDTLFIILAIVVVVVIIGILFAVGKSFIGTILAIVIVVGVLSLFVGAFFNEWLREREVRRVENSKVCVFVSSVVSLNKKDVNLHLAPSIEQALTQNVDFYRVSLVADFYPAKNSKFVFAKINVELVSPLTTTYSMASTTTYSIAPLKVDSETKITTKYAIDPEFKLAETASISLGSVTQEKVYRKLHPYIIGHFDGKHTASWEFRTTDTIDNIEGVQFLEFTVKQPANVKSDWQALPEGELNWRGRTQRPKSAITHVDHPVHENKLVPFSIPLQ
jgi:hypothetical protein